MSLVRLRALGPRSTKPLRRLVATQRSTAPPTEVEVVTVTWNVEACRRAGLTDDDLLALSASEESGYSVEVVQRFLDNLPKPQRPAPPATRPRVVYVGTEIDAIVARNPELFGKGKR